MTVGATTVFTTDASPESAFAAIAGHGVTVTALMPALAKLWEQACDWEPVTPKTLRLLQVGGAKLKTRRSWSTERGPYTFNGGGATVSAADLENHLLAHPAIRAAAAVGLPDHAESPPIPDQTCWSSWPR